MTDLSYTQTKIRLRFERNSCYQENPRKTHCYSDLFLKALLHSAALPPLPDLYNCQVFSSVSNAARGARAAARHDKRS